MFYGGKGLLYLNEKDVQFSPEQLLLSFDACMRNQYGQKHYTEYLKKFYQKNHIVTDKKGRIPVTASEEIAGLNVFIIKSEAPHRQYLKNDSFYDENDTVQKRRTVTGMLCITAVNCSEILRTEKNITIILNYFTLH